MMFKRMGVAAMLLGSFACTEAESASDTSELSRSLLEQPADDGTSTLVPPPPRPAADEGPRVPVSMVGFNRGSEQALVKVVELSDYGCGYCRQFHQETFPSLLAEYVETGMVEWKFVPYITGMFENSLAATEAAECAYVQGEEAFEQLNRRLWSDQAAWKRSDQAETVVRSWVEALGLDMGDFDSCIVEDQRLQRIAASTTLAGQIGVRGTPTFIVLGVDGRYPPLQGALALDTFREILTAVHEEASRESAGQP